MVFDDVVGDELRRRQEKEGKGLVRVRGRGRRKREDASRRRERGREETHGSDGSEKSHERNEESSSNRGVLLNGRPGSLSLGVLCIREKKKAIRRISVAFFLSSSTTQLAYSPS